MNKKPSIRPVLGILVFMELLFWGAVVGGWLTAKSVVPSLELHRQDAAPLLLVVAAATFIMIWHLDVAL